MKRSGPTTILVLFLSLVTCRFARATSTTFPAFDVWPSAGDRSFLMIPSTQGFYRRQYGIEISNQFVSGSLDLLDPTNRPIRPVVDYFFGHFISGTLGLADFWQIGITLPFFSSARFEPPTPGVPTSPGNFTDIGDLRIQSKLRLLDANRLRLGLAVEPFFTVPLGADQHFMGSASIAGGTKVIGDLFLNRRIRLSLNLGPEFLADEVQVNNLQYSHRWLSGAGISLSPTRQITLSGEAQVNSAFRDFFSNRNTLPVELLAGGRWDVGRTGFSLALGGGSCIVCGARGARVRTLLTIGYRRMSEIYTLKEQKELKMRYVALGGKPEPELTLYEIVELVAQCPIDSGRYQVDRDSSQCMEIYELQQIAETCPPETRFDPLRDNPACPKIYSLQGVDSDRDRIPDFIDWCPHDRGTGEERGCPAKGYLLADVVENQILSPMVLFEYDRAYIQSGSLPILDRLVEAMKEHPVVRKMAIEGHTDDRGDDEYNQELSEERARTIFEYFVDHGIDPERLSCDGFGEKYPIAFNDTEEGRTKNRRVEFIIDRLTQGEIPLSP